MRRIRFATKGLAIMPMKFTSDTEWVEALGGLQLGRERMKEVALHTHFITDREITAWTARAWKHWRRPACCETSPCSSAG